MKHPPYFSTLLITICFLYNSIGLCQVQIGDPNAADNFSNPCPLSGEPKDAEFNLWSDPSSWENSIVPGIGNNIGSDAIIPCGKNILLDVPNLTLNLLNVKGYLKFLDSNTVGDIYMKANYVLVEGYLTIGTELKQFSRKVTIELTPNYATDRSPLFFSSIPPADASHARNLGPKVFAVVGGRVSLHGFPGPRNMIVWCKLIETALPGTKSITLDSFVKWPVGSQIAIASTDYDNRQTEIFTVVKVSKTRKGSKLWLDSPITYMHYGDPKGLRDSYGGFIDQRAEVALLSRQIKITGTQEPLYPLQGGHFIIFQTQTPQYIEGVSFVGMGQQGIKGKYPIHFHFHGTQGGPQGTYCIGNSILHSLQRCIVVHGTNRLQIKDNVAYNNSGHCFMVEDGGEIENDFIHNIGLLTSKVKRLVQVGASDMKPSTFWMTNPNNNLINNTAVGSEDSGIWYEMQRNITGPSADLSYLKRVSPQSAQLGKVYGNTIHSCKIGLKTYPRGMHPKGLAPMVMEKFNIYKNSWKGIFAKHLETLIIEKATLSDNGVAVYFDFAQASLINNSVIVGLTKNYGDTKSCRMKPYTTCRPVSDCTKLPNSVMRNIGYNQYKNIFVGVYFQTSKKSDDGTLPNHIVNTKFSGFNDACFKAAAISTNLEGQGEYWNSANSIQNVKFAADTNPLWLDQSVNAPSKIVPFMKKLIKEFTLRDVDGSLLGLPGYVVGPKPEILPTEASQCKFQPRWNMYGCSKTCYRTVLVTYLEPGFNPSGTAQAGDFSSLLAKRVVDGKTIQADGNYLQTRPIAGVPVSTRFFYFNILAGETYELGWKNPKDPNFVPSGLVIRYSDGGGCGTGLTFRIPAASGTQWVVSSSTNVLSNSCPGAAEPEPQVSQYTFVCDSQNNYLRLKLGSITSRPIRIDSQKLAASKCPVSYCGAFAQRSNGWLMNLSGQELRPAFIQPIYDESSWVPYGVGTSSTPLQKILKPPSKQLRTYYFRKSFNLQKASCYLQLNMGLYLSDGAVVYLNGKNILSVNMPDNTPINFQTWAIKSQNGLKRFFFDLSSSTAGAALVEGKNYIAVETHSGRASNKMMFDMDIMLLKGQC